MTEIQAVDGATRKAFQPEIVKGIEEIKIIPGSKF